jgi:hypothetical protein
MIATGMKGRLASSRLRRLARLALALFTVFLMTEQLEHHDIVCHLKTPQHCTACAASPLGADPESPAVIDRVVLADAGHAVLASVRLTGTVLPARSSGRSPPAA